MNVLAFVSAAWWAILAAVIVGVVVALVLYKVTRRAGKSAVVGLLVSIVIFLLSVAFSSFTKVPYGHAGVLIQYGGITGRVLEPGLQTKVPFIETFYKYPTVIKVYETSYNPDSTGADYPDYVVDSKTVDGQEVELAYSVKFRVDPENAAFVLQNIGDLTQVIEKVVKDSRSLVREKASGFKAVELNDDTGKERLSKIMRLELERDFAPFRVSFVDFLLREVTFSDLYQASAEKKVIAEQDAERAKILVEQRKHEAEQKRQEAKGLADAAVIAAEGEAKSVKISAEAEAESIRLRGEALKRFPEILQLTFVQNLGDKWGFLPSSGVEYLMPLPTQP